MAQTLYNLGDLYRATQRPKEAEAAYTEALKTFRELAIANPEGYRVDLVRILNKLGVLYMSEGDSGKATPFCSEAVEMLKRLSAEDPTKYSSLLSRICAEHK